MGTVYKAEQREPVRRMVAIKVIKLGMDSKEVVARFEAERQALALMDHPEHHARARWGGDGIDGRPVGRDGARAGCSRSPDYCDKARAHDPASASRLFVQRSATPSSMPTRRASSIATSSRVQRPSVPPRRHARIPKVIDFGDRQGSRAVVDRQDAPHAQRPGDRHAGLHEPGAVVGLGPRRRHADGRVLARRRALRAVDGLAALRLRRRDDPARGASARSRGAISRSRPRRRASRRSPARKATPWRGSARRASTPCAGT